MRQYSSNLAFIDFLFILLLAFISMFILALILINPITKKSEVERRAEFLIVLEWDKNSADDVDIWVEDPSGQVLSFRNKTIGVMHLDKDDLGHQNDVIHLPDGTSQIIYLNREVVTLRGWLPGEYIINTHMYAKRDDWGEENPNRPTPTQIKVEMLRINPYKILFEDNFTLQNRGEETTVRRITLNKEGQIIDTNKLNKSFVTLSLGGGP